MKKTKYLISSLDHLGDFIQRIPLMRYLRSEGHDITVIGYNYIQCLVNRVPEVSTFIDYEKWKQKSDSEIQQTLQIFDSVLIMRGHCDDMNLLKKSYSANIKERIGSKRSFRDRRLLTKNIKAWRDPLMHESEIALKFLDLHHTDVSHFYDDLLRVKYPIRQSNKPILLIHPGSNGNGREWQIERYRELINRLKEKFHLVITGSKAEQQRFASLEELGVDSFMGKTNMNQFIHLLETSHGILSSGTGPLHISAAFNRKAIGLFPLIEGANSFKWRPLGEKTTIIEAKIICKYCKIHRMGLFRRKCECMNAISVDEVVAACQEIIY